MLLTETGTRIEGPQDEVLTVLFAALTQALITDTDLTPVDAERLAMKILVRLQVRLADRGCITRPIYADEPLELPHLTERDG